MSALEELEPRGLAAVLFDMDGTLIDTEPSWIAAEMALVGEFGGSWTLADGQSLVGNSLMASAAVLRERGGVALPDEEIVDRLLDHMVEAVREGVQWQPGALDLLGELTEAGLPCAVVTSSYRNLAEAVLAHLPSGTFDVLVTGDEVRVGKPHPDPYLLAAARLGVATELCVAVEDSLPGLTSALRAGCVAVAVPHVVPIPDVPELSAAFRWDSLAGRSLTDLRELFD